MINQIINGDNVETLKTFPENYIDLTVTSPPYDNLRTYKGHTWDFEGVANELFRVTKRGGVVVWVVGDATINGSETGTSFKQALYFMDIGFRLHDTMIYEKSGCPYPETNRYYPIFEYMFILSKGKPKTANLIADRKNNFSGHTADRKNAGRQQDGTVKENTAYRHNLNRKIKENGVRFNIWRFITSRNAGDNNIHPATFPEQLAHDHIISWSNECDVVLDPFSGSGTTCKMAKLLNRNYIGIEVAKEYCGIAEQRINQYNKAC